jgi:transposase
MSSVPDQLPDDVDALKELVVAKATKLDEIAARNEQLSAQVITLQEQLNIALAKRFASRSEQLSPDQIKLFDEAESTAEETVATDAEESVTVSSHRRKTGVRKPLPARLERIDIIHDLPESERRCDHDGRTLKEINEVISEQLDIVPARIQVLRHIRKQYACDCGRCIKTAPLPAQPIPKSMASPGLLAHVTVSKYQDGLPLYRQETILKRIGIELPRATLANWMIKAGTLVQPLINLMRDRLLEYDIIQMDETPVQVLKEAGRRAQSKSYLWVQRGGPPDGRVILYDYDPSRSGAVPERLLSGYLGYLQTDGYVGYNAVVVANRLSSLGCMAHARRRFDEAVKAQGKNKRRGKAWRGLALIQKLYRIEKQARRMLPDERYVHRLEHATPIFTEMRDWLDQSLPQVPPKNATGKALTYLNAQWDKLTRYLDDGRLEIDNNRCENAIRPFVMGRKAWLFSDSVAGVKASANLYSLIETAKAHGLEPYAYLREVFAKLPAATTVEAIEAMLPGNLNANQITPT